jgi:hypothetical protein
MVSGVLRFLIGPYHGDWGSGWWLTKHLEKYDFANGKNDIPYYGNLKIFETTNQIYIYTYRINNGLIYKLRKKTHPITYKLKFFLTVTESHLITNGFICKYQSRYFLRRDFTPSHPAYESLEPWNPAGCKAWFIPLNNIADVCYPIISHHYHHYIHFIMLSCFHEAYFCIPIYAILTIFI